MPGVRLLSSLGKCSSDLFTSSQVLAGYSNDRVRLYERVVQGSDEIEMCLLWPVMIAIAAYFQGIRSRQYMYPMAPKITLQNMTLCS